MTDSEHTGNVISVSIRKMTSDEQLSAIEAKVDAWGKSTAIYFPPPNHLTLAESRWLIARVRELTAQVEIGRLAEEYVLAVHAEYEVETLGLDGEAFAAEWDRRWDVADAAYERLREKVDVALAARKPSE